MNLARQLGLLEAAPPEALDCCGSYPQLSGLMMNERKHPVLPNPSDKLNRPQKLGIIPAVQSLRR